MRALGLVLVVACHHVVTPLAKEQVQSAFVDAECSYLVRCGELPDAASCHRAYLGLHFPFVDATRFGAIDAGKIVYDGVAAHECIDAIAAASCDRTDETARLPDPSCARVVAGTVGAGAACTLDEECVSQACAIPICTTTCCAGQCTGGIAPAAQPIGGSCANRNTCAPGGYCDNTQTCVALVAKGGDCKFDFQCAYGAACVATTCAALPVVGQACAAASGCRDNGTTCNAVAQCAALGLPGAACATRADCSPFYTCDATGRCAEGSSLGGACTVDTDCFDQTYCAASHTCEPPPPDGSPCDPTSPTSDRDCASENCDETTMTCSALPMCV